MGENNQIRCVVYCRVSTTDQTSTKEQAEEIKQWCESNNRIIYKTVEEKRSAKADENEIDVYKYLEKRPLLYEIIKDSKKGLFDELIVWKWDRLARDDLFQESIYRILNKNNVKIFALRGSRESLGRKVEGIVASDETKKKKERVEIRHQSLLKEKRVLNRPPIGYRFNSKHQIVPDINKNNVIRIFELTTQGLHPKDICEKVSIIRKIRSKKNLDKKVNKEVLLSLSTYKRIIRNKTYIGIYKFRGEEKEGDFETFISKELFEKANKKG